MLSTLRIVTALTVALLTAPLAAEAEAATTAELVSRGESQLAEQDVDAAIATLHQAVAADPSSSVAHTRLGGAYLLGQRYTEAIDQFQQAIAIDADNAAAFIGIDSDEIGRAHV